MKALIVDPAVHSRGGHHHAAVKRLQTELAQLGIKAPCLGSAYATPDIVRDHKRTTHRPPEPILIPWVRAVLRPITH